MTYGELAEYNQSYQDGHSKGIERAIAHAKYYLIAKKKKKFTAEEVISLLDESKVDFLKICETYGMGKEEDEEEYD